MNYTRNNVSLRERDYELHMDNRFNGINKYIID